ncbi:MULTISPECIES: peptidoglycan-binding protein [unclassified Streptomyces]|uniref:efflux RND transporter periplasmic adaptor subunit n=1 Tax=unclassified Streptomyces TaxID=2593676 RepID=UPI00342A1DEC
MKHKKLLLTLGATALVAVGGAVAVTVPAESGSAPSADSTSVPTATADVTKGDLVTTDKAKGTLGFSAQRAITAEGQGVLTWLPSGGGTIERNGKLYEVDGSPVFLMYGQTPAYRVLARGDEGEDVHRLKENLIALGFGSGLAADDEFTKGTERGVKAWQKSKGLEQTGKIGPDQIAFAPGAVRVQNADAAVGARVTPGMAVLTTTSSERVVQFDLSVAKADKIKAGDAVTVELPGGAGAEGRISSIGRTAQTDEQSPDKEAVIKVTVEFDEPEKVSGVDKAPVTVRLTGERREDVLSVPVEALLAVDGGGFGVRVVEGDTARDVRVKLGLFAGGRVEVSGGNLRAGMKVGVPA